MTSRARVILLNAALGPLDYRVPHGMRVEPGSIVVAPLGPRQVIGVVWEPERTPTEEVGDNRLRPLLHAYELAPLGSPLRRLIEWTADYYLAPLGSVLRMALPSTSALEGARTVTEYRATGLVPDRITPQRAQALERIGERRQFVGVEQRPEPVVADLLRLRPLRLPDDADDLARPQRRDDDGAGLDPHAFRHPVVERAQGGVEENDAGTAAHAARISLFWRNPEGRLRRMG